MPVFRMAAAELDSKNGLYTFIWIAFVTGDNISGKGDFHWRSHTLW
jgi:hypothetical protein